MGSTAASRPRSKAPGSTERVEVMLACVRAAGLKLTPQRMAIVRELAADPTHPTAQELFERLRPALPTMSFATVYNTLDALANAGLCAALSLAPGPARFDPNMRPHHHAVCDRCGLVRDIPCEPTHSAPAPSDLATAPGFEVRAIEHIYRGLCAGCSTKTARNPGVAAAAGARPRRG
jgi:Fur family peroxide stress response transcriptional regulator